MKSLKKNVVDIGVYQNSMQVNNCVTIMQTAQGHHDVELHAMEMNELQY